jgi:hypothetical protein
MKTIFIPVPEPGESCNPVTNFMDNPSIKVISTQIVMVPQVQIVYESLSDPESLERAIKYESLTQKRLCAIAQRVITKEAYTKLKNSKQRQEYLLAFEGISIIEADRVVELAKPEMDIVRKKILVD